MADHKDVVVLLLMGQERGKEVTSNLWASNTLHKVYEESCQLQCHSDGLYDQTGQAMKIVDENKQARSAVRQEW